jgi:hypothetical protein
MPYFTIIIIIQCLILQNYHLQNALFYNMYLSTQNVHLPTQEIENIDYQIFSL